MRSRFLLLAVLAFGLPALHAPTASAQTVIKVVANGIAITSYDISQRTRLKQIANEKGGAKAATDELIDEAIQIYEAKRVGITISDKDVNNAFNGIAKQVKLSPTQFSQALGQQGINASTLKSRLRAQMAWHTLVQARMQRAAAFGTKEVEDQLAKGGNPKVETTSEFILKQILFVVPKGSSSGYVAQRRREAEAFRIRFTGCDKAIAQTSGLRDVAVRDLGRRNSTELGAGNQANAIKATPIGKTAPPNATDQGVELIAVCGKKEIQGQTAARQEVENKLAQKQGEEVAANYLKELKGKAVIEYR